MDEILTTLDRGVKQELRQYGLWEVNCLKKQSIFPTKRAGTSSSSVKNLYDIIAKLID
jgi:hypothetical protein